jgi:hypothetical protein
MPERFNVFNEALRQYKGGFAILQALFQYRYQPVFPVYKIALQNMFPGFFYKP